MTRKVLLIVLAVGLLAGAAAVGVNSWRRTREDPFAVAAMGTISQIVVATGRVEPVTEIILANKIPGRIKAVLVREGNPITVGQPLILFDDQEYETQVRMARTRIATAEAEARRAQRGLELARAQWVEVKSGARPQEIERARAELEEARRRQQNADLDRQRAKQLLEGEFIARAQYDAAETEADVARARVRGAEETLNLLLAGPKRETVEAAWARVQEADAELKQAQSRVVTARADLDHARAVLQTTVVESTVNGKVTRKLVEPGEAVDIGVPLMILADVQKTLVKAEVDETDVGKLALGQSGQITADAYPGRAFPGIVTEIGQAVGKRKIRPDDPTKIQDMKVLETKLEVTEGGADLKLGMTVDVKIWVAYKERALLLPKRLVPAGSQEITLQVLGPNGPEPRRLQLGPRDDENVEVTAGLRPGERVVVPMRTR